MSSVAVYFDTPGFNSYPFNKPDYVEAYHEIAALTEQKGGQFGIVRGQESYRGGNTFEGGWLFEDGSFRRQVKELVFDVIYDKSTERAPFQPDDTCVLANPRELDRLCTDKWLAYQTFPSLFPLTRLVTNADELEQALREIQTRLIVAKPVGGDQGRGVIIGTPDEVRAGVGRFPYLVQAFIDTSGGIPGLVEGNHDFRIININGELVLSYIRTPPPNKLQANVAQGGKEVYVAPASIPAEALKIASEVDAYMGEHFPWRIYTVDMGLDADGTWKIIELNAKPAVNAHKDSLLWPAYQEKLVTALLS